jgi:hypothetical protein
MELAENAVNVALLLRFKRRLGVCKGLDSLEEVQARAHQPGKRRWWKREPRWHMLEKAPSSIM